MANHLVLAACWSAETPGRRFRTLARATSSIDWVLSAAWGRLDAISFDRAARAQSRSRPGLVALASPCVGTRCGMLMQTSSCGSEFILLDCFRCAALARWMVPTMLASRSNQKWVGVLTSPAGRGHVAMRQGWTRRLWQSGQVVKSLQILAMAAGTACLLLKSSSSELVGELQEAWLYAMLMSFSRLEALYSHLRSHRIGMSKRALFYVLPSCFELGMMVASYGMKKNGPCCAYLVLFFICSGYSRGGASVMID